MFDAILFYLLPAFLWSIAVLWTAAILWTRREMLPPLKPTTKSELSKAPKISVLLPARNEEKRILRLCVESLLNQNYENFEIVAVDDNSIDRTGEILRSFDNPKLRVVDGAKLPADSLGKPFVLQQAFEKTAASCWILTTDADIIFAPDALATAISHAERNGFDVLCLLPFDRCETFWERTFIGLFSWFRFLKMPPSKVNKPYHAKALGVGNFFLVRRASLEKVNGFQAVKTEVAEDLKLAELLKRSGARFRLEFAPDLIQTRMYAGFGEIWGGFTKNFFAAADFSVSSAMFGASSLILFGVLPFAALIAALSWWIVTRQDFVWHLLAPLIFIYLLQIINYAVFYRNLRQPIFYAVFAPLGIGLFAAILVNSTIKVLSGNGVTWKGRAIYNRRDEIAEK